MGIIKKFILLTLVVLPINLVAEELLLSSKNKNPILIELYTSQGCSSCPPAEKYLNQFSQNKQLWDKFIPIAFHVNYWDYIGWKDIFAEPRFGRRQSRYAKLKHLRTVYTPAFIMNGAVWRRGFFNAEPQVKGLSVGELNISIKDQLIDATFKTNKRLREKLKLNIAVLGMDMAVDITAGENDGRQSKHSFVVLGYDERVSSEGKWQLSIPEYKKSVAAKRYAIAAWVSELNNPAPLQAVGGWINFKK